ncbi:MAG: porin [Pseudomonadota bacterium]
MKKILLATTLLVASTGFAAAELTTTGAARMGMIYNGTDTEFTSRVRITFTGSGETDGGLTFGASVRADQIGGNGGTSTGTTNGDSTVYISGAFGKLTMGDVGGAADALVGNVSGVGLTGLGSLNEMGYIGTSKTAAYYEYSTNGLTFGVGVGQPTGANPSGSVAVKYSTDSFSVALGYEDGVVGAVDATQTSLGVTGSFSGVSLKAVVKDLSTNADLSYAVSADYTSGATTVTAFYADNGTEVYGLGAAYDLGGSAKVVGGVVDNGTNTVADLGVSFSF